ncbi:MAG: DedA family protein [Bacteroidales bacterium]|jgi:membrane protein YqaA with SNARE-associated domain|nr:DedA family protein [Bacteroidales bacterium]
MESLIRFGYIGLFIGCFLASTIIPFSSDILLTGVLLMGANPYIALIVATSGNWLGGMTTYGLGYLGKWQWIEKWFKVKPETLEKQKEKVDKYGNLLAFFTWLPFVGDILALALGFYKISPKLSALFMFIGRFMRFSIWTLLYINFGENFLNFISR